MTANVFGTPIYVTSFDKDQSQSGKKNSTMTDRLKEVLKALQPLDKAISSLESAVSALDGTGYEEIKNAISKLKNQVEAKQQEILGQMTGGKQVSTDNPNENAPENKSTAPTAPTAGQISGREPLSDDSIYL